MKEKLKILIYLIPILILTSCSQKVYFNAQVRKQLEQLNIPLDKLNYYVDRDVILRREMSSEETTASSGIVKFENGKYINIIKLRMYTTGVCTKISPNKLNIAFEDGSNFLTFGYPKNGTNENAYQINADEWKNDIGKITYEGKVFYIDEKSSDAKIKINQQWKAKKAVNQRVMKGRKVQ